MSSHPRTIFLAQFNQLGGAERACLALARCLHFRAIPFRFVTYADYARIAQFADFPLPVIELRPRMRLPSKLAALRRFLASRTAAEPPMLLNGYQDALHCTLAGLRGFHTLMHDTPILFGDHPARGTLRYNLRVALMNCIIGHGLRSGGRTFVTSEFLRAETLRDFRAPADIVRMGGMATPGEFRLRPVSGPLRLLSVSRIEANKRIDWMLRALAALQRDGLSARADWSLDIAGKGPLLEPLRALAAELGLTDRVHFHGFVSDDRLRDLYANAHLFLMPAVQGYGIPAIESLQRGIPILIHRHSGVSDILLDAPWATVLTGGEESMLPALRSAVESVLAGRHLAVPLPNLPTEDSWAETIATRCGWL